MGKVCCRSFCGTCTTVCSGWAYRVDRHRMYPPHSTWASNPSGLDNEHNNCWLNSLAQCLAVFRRSGLVFARGKILYRTATQVNRYPGCQEQPSTEHMCKFCMLERLTRSVVARKATIWPTGRQIDELTKSSPSIAEILQDGRQHDPMDLMQLLDPS